MSKGLITLSVVLAAAATLPGNAQVIQSVERRNPSPAGSMVQVRLAPGSLGDGARAYADRTHIYRNVPDVLAGGQYVQMSNEDKVSPNLELHVTIGRAGTLYLLIDNRVGTNMRDPAIAPDPMAAGMFWVAQLGFADTGMKMGLDENADGSVNNYYSVFSKQVSPGVIVLKAQNDRFTGGPYDRNMYGVAAVAVYKATNPVPADGQYVTTAPLLQWTPGTAAAFHNVYVGTNPQLGQADLVGLYVPVPSFQYPQALTPGVTHYWRVDEVEADRVTVTTGDVWSFKAASVAAFGPVPPDGTPWVDTDTTLSWQPGRDALLHDLYFGEDRAAVEAGHRSVFQGTHYFASWHPPALEPDKTYFWRVDEVAADGTRETGPVWSFSTVQSIAIRDPSLLAWWKMDESAGARVADWSGYSRHAQFANPAPARAIGLLGGALRFAGNGDSVVYGDGSFLNGLDALTITVWVKSNVTNTDRGFLIFETPNGEDDRGMRYDAAGITAGGQNVMKMGVTISENGLDTTLQLESSNDSQTTDWQHLALVWSSGQALALYIDGQIDSPTSGSVVRTGCLVNYSTVLIGKGSKDVVGSSWDGLIDDLRIYARALTGEEIQAILHGDPSVAWNPSPANGTTENVFEAFPMTWQAGDQAIAHDVYLGDDQAAVGEATVSDTTGVYRGRQSGTSFTPTPPLELCVRYFWRIDEINSDGTISRGFVWDFMLDD